MKRRTKRIAVAALAVLVTAAGAAGAAGSTLLIVSACRAAKWPTTEGAIVDSMIVEEKRQRRRRRGRRGEYTVYTPRIVYEYEVDGKTYKSDRIGYSNYESIAPVGEFFEEIIQCRRGDSKIQVYFNPQYPGDATLEIDSPVYPYLLLLITSMFSLVGLVLFIAVLRGKVRSLEDLFE